MQESLNDHSASISFAHDGLVEARPPCAIIDWLYSRDDGIDVWTKTESTQQLRRVPDPPVIVFEQKGQGIIA